MRIPKQRRPYVTPHDDWPWWTIVVVLGFAGLLLVLKLWAYDWDVSCFFIECRKLHP